MANSPTQESQAEPGRSRSVGGGRSRTGFQQAPRATGFGPPLARLPWSLLALLRLRELPEGRASGGASSPSPEAATPADESSLCPAPWPSYAIEE